ncbi:MAG: M20 family peptidase, partial [Demequina sp.]
MTDLLTDARARLTAMLDDVVRLIECESPSDDLAAISHSADVVADVLGPRLAAAGLPKDPERIVIDGVTHLRWRLGGPTRVLLLGHHDTVWPHGSLASHPAQIADGVLTGPGCYDMAIGLVQAAHA